MATGRTTSRHARVYANGYNLCGYTRSIGPLTWTYDEADLTTMCDAGRGYLPGMPTVTIGAWNAVLDNDGAAGLFALQSSGSLGVDLMIPVGIRTAPAAGDPVFCARPRTISYTASEDGGAITASMTTSAWDMADMPAYAIPWGVLSHALGAETGANSGTGVDGAAATSTGGYIMYQVTAGNGTATISLDDSADNVNFLAVTGATSGSIDCNTPKSNIIELGKTATIRRYTRWQIALGGATTVTFALALVRGR